MLREFIAYHGKLKAPLTKDNRVSRKYSEIWVEFLAKSVRVKYSEVVIVYI